MKREVISMRVSAEVKTAAAKAAKADSRSLASLAEKVLREFLIKGGYLKK